MSSEDVNEPCEYPVLEKVHKKKGRRLLAMLYKSRFGKMPRAMVNAIKQTQDTAVLERWIVIVISESREEIAEAIQVRRRVLAS